MLLEECQRCRLLEEEEEEVMVEEVEREVVEGGEEVEVVVLPAPGSAMPLPPWRPRAPSQG